MLDDDGDDGEDVDAVSDRWEMDAGLCIGVIGGTHLISHTASSSSFSYPHYYHPHFFLK